MPDNVTSINHMLGCMRDWPDAYGRVRSGLASLAGHGHRGLVSGIIPCYSYEKYIKEAIDSSLSQTYTNCEVIVIDDGSTDQSLELIKGYGSQIVWRMKANGGATAARNDGLELARGEFIQFLDGDDVLLADAVERRLASMEGVSDAVFGDMKSVDENGQFHGRVFRHGPPSLAASGHGDPCSDQ